MNAEFERFLHLFDQLAKFGEDWLDRMPADKLDWAPIEGPTIRFGDRVSRISVKGLVIHVAVGEQHWVEQMKSCAAGATIPVPKRPALEAELAAGDFRETTRAMHRADMAALRSYGDDVLAKDIVFADRRWSVLGFCWAIYSHRAFHLGNIDIYLRQAGVVAPDYFRFPAFEMA